MFWKNGDSTASRFVLTEERIANQQDIQAFEPARCQNDTICWTRRKTGSSIKRLVPMSVLDLSSNAVK